MDLFYITNSSNIWSVSILNDIFTLNFSVFNSLFCIERLRKQQLVQTFVPR